MTVYQNASLFMGSNSQISVNGQLTAIGEVGDNEIEFSAEATNITWQGIRFNDLANDQSIIKSRKRI